MTKIDIQKVKKDWFGAFKGIGGPLQTEEKVDIKWWVFERHSRSDCYLTTLQKQKTYK